MFRTLKAGSMAVAMVFGLTGAAAANCGLIVLFDTGQGSIGAGAATTVANYATQNPNVSVAVNGYTDASGDAAANRRLSQRRAESVAAVIADSAGATVASVTGVGEAIRPDTSGPTDPRNRRVEVVNTACDGGLFGTDAAAAAGTGVVGPGALAVAGGIGGIALLAAAGGDDDDDDDNSVVSTPSTP